MKILGFMAWLSILVLLNACQQEVDLDAERAAIQRTAAEHAEATSTGGDEGAEAYASRRDVTKCGIKNGVKERENAFQETMVSVEMVSIGRVGER